MGPIQILTNKKFVKECVASIILFLFIKCVSAPIELGNATSCSKKQKPLYCAAKHNPKEK
jgi:hypothetical protein